MNQNPMVLVDSYAQTYRWSMTEILDMTLPQIYMLSGAAAANRRRLDKNVKTQSRTVPSTPIRNDQVVWNGKALNQLNSEEYMQYVAAGQFG